LTTPIPGQQSAQQLQNTYESQLRASITNQATQQGNQGVVPDWLQQPVEWAGSKMYAIYSKYVSRPVTTALLATGDLSNNNQGSVFSGDTWDRAWTDAKHVSPGQVLYANFIKDPEGNGKFESGMNKDGTLIWDHPDQVANYYNHGVQAWVSGGLDAGFSWYADPLVLAGKAAKATKVAGYVRPSIETANETMLGAATKGAIGLTGKVIRSTPEQIDAAQAAFDGRRFNNSIEKNLTNSTFNKFGDYIESNKQKLGADFPAWAARQKWATQGGNSSGIAAAFTHAADRDEINNVLKVAMGDQTAIANIAPKNAELAAQLTNLTGSRDRLYANLPKFPNPNSPGAVQVANQLQSISDQISAIDAQTGKLSRQAAIAGQMKEGMYFTPGLTPLMAKIGQDANKAITPHSMNLLYSNFFVRPVRMVNFIGDKWNNVMPKGWVKLDDPSSYREVDAELRESKVYNDVERGQLVGEYISAPYQAKRQILMNLEAKTLGRLALKHGVDEDNAKKIYQVFNEGRANYMGNANIYGGSRITTSGGTELNVSHIEDDGSIVATHPVFGSQLENHHPVMDFGKMNQLLRNNAGAFNKLLGSGKTADEAAQGITTGLRPGLAAQKAADGYQSFSGLFNHLWKFQAHLRLGYGPRAIADDLAGQVAMLGAHSMASRTMQGLYGQAARKAGNANSRFLYDATGFDAKNIAYKSAVSQLQDDLELAKTRLATVQSYIPQSNKTAARQATMALFHRQGIEQIESQLDGAKLAEANLTQARRKLTDKRVINPNGQVVAGAGEGAQGQMFLDMNSGRSTYDSALGGTASHIQSGIRGNPGWVEIDPTQGGHLGSWLRVVQRQIASDPAAMIAVKGGSVNDIEKWLNGAGRQYFKDLQLDNMSAHEMADRIHSEVNYQLPVASPKLGELRQAVADNKDDATIAKLMSETEQAYRPTVNGERSNYALGRGGTIQAIDKVISKWYRMMAETPGNVLSRNPLFAKLYEGHVQDMYKMAEAQGLTHLSNDHLDQIATSARQLALRDVKKFTYNMDFETKITHSMRFIAPFFGPMQEAFNRWGRILAAKPETLARAGMLYTSPARIGHAYTYNNDPIVNGYSIDPATGKKVLVDKSDTYIRFQLPKYMSDALGLGATPVARIPLNSLNIALQNDPWYNPGEGPIVQMAANHFAVKAPPQVGDFFQKIGILPTGITAHDSDVLWGGIVHSIIKSNDDGTASQMTLQAMQQQDYMYRNGLRSTPPTMAEAKKRGENMVFLKALFSGTVVLPFGVSFQDPYQFYRDQYKTMQAANPQTADQNFYAKYGDSAYAFTTSLSQNNIPGIPATRAGQNTANKFKDLIDQYPDLAGVIIGDQGGGDFSQTAYMQQVISGQRTKMSASDAWKKSQANTGWQEYTAFMNGLNAQLFQRGLTTLNDKGAEDLLAQKKAFVQTLSDPYNLDGQTANPYYNASWTEAYNTFDPSKDDRQALALTQIATAKELQNRPDITGLQQYLNLRGTIKTELAQRAGDNTNYNFRSAQTASSGDINAKSNADLKSEFQNGVMQLIEGNTYFQTLHDRYLSKDMFDHYDGTGLTNSITGEQ